MLHVCDMHSQCANFRDFVHNAAYKFALYVLKSCREVLTLLRLVNITKCACVRASLSRTVTEDD